MKRIIIAACLGISVCAANSSFGQAVILFDNYGSYPVQYDPDPAKVPPGTAGQLVGSTFHVDLLYGFGTISDPSLLVSAGLSVPIDPGMPGYFHGGAVSLPGYVSGPITLMVEAWETAGPYGGSTFNSSLLRGASPMFTQSMGTFSLPGPINVDLVPEPAFLSLAGLAMLSVAITRRFKSSSTAC